MSPLKTSLLFAVLSVVSACGRQVVEFKNGGTDGGGSDSGGSGSGNAPVVIFTVPANQATGVARDTTITATFDKTMDPATITSTTFLVSQSGSPVTGSVTLDSPTNTAIFTASALLATNTLFTATITVGAKDTGGHALAANHVWTFTTGTAVNANPPTVIFTSPADLATNVTVNKHPTATFSKAMNAATLNSTTFTLQQGVTPVAGAVTYNAATNTAMFTPTTPLAISTTYTGTITTGAKDTGGLALAANYTWSFTTGACSLAPVNLRSAAGFAVLAGSTVTSTGATSVTGDLGVSPGTAVTGFPPATIVGMIHAGDTPAATAIGDLGTAYNDAAGRTVCPIGVAGDLGGLTLTPGLYHSTSSLAITTGALTLDAQGDPDAIFVFQMATTLATSAAGPVVLTNGAKSANIFWQVGTSATLGMGSVFKGTIMADQSITMVTGASIDGRVLAHMYAFGESRRDSCGAASYVLRQWTRGRSRVARRKMFVASNC